MKEKKRYPGEIGGLVKYKQAIRWVDGLPEGIDMIKIKKEAIIPTLLTALGLQKTDINSKLEDEYDLSGATALEIAFIRLVDKAVEGDLLALEKILDRILGKPMTKTMTANANDMYSKFLKNLEEEEDGNGTDSTEIKN